MRNRTPSYFIAAGLVALAACSDTATEPTKGATDGALVTFAFDGHPADTLRVWMTDSASIKAAERYVQTKTGPKMLIGTIERGYGFDNVHPFRFRPETVRLVDNAIEICDGAPMRSAADVDQFLEWSTGNRASTSGTYCPWSSYPIRVERLAID
jgi:hypothetical protein